MSLERQQLNVAAAIYKVQRAALADCVQVIEVLHDVDKFTGNRDRLWARDGQYGSALYNAKKALMPRGVK